MSASTSGTRAKTIDLDLLLKQLGELRVIGLVHGRPPEMRRQLALAELKRTGVELRGAHESLIEKVVSFEDDRQTALLQARDDQVERLLHSRTNGRPNKHPVLRDFLVFAAQRWFQYGGRLQARDARKRTAQIFGLTCDTKFARTRRPSIEQVRRAEMRTLARLELFRKVYGDELLKPVWLRGVRVLDLYTRGLDGAPFAAAFHADATRLVSLCRLLDALKRSERIERTTACKVAKRVPRQPGKAAGPSVN